MYKKETFIYEESIHVRFNEKGFDHKKIKTSRSFCRYSAIRRNRKIPSNEADNGANESNKAYYEKMMTLSLVVKVNLNQDYEEIQVISSSTLIIRDVKDPLRTRSPFKEQLTLRLISLIEPNSIDEASSNDGWIVAMQEKLNQFKRNGV